MHAGAGACVGVQVRRCVRTGMHGCMGVRAWVRGCAGACECVRVRVRARAGVCMCMRVYVHMRTLPPLNFKGRFLGESEWLDFPGYFRNLSL